MTTTDLDQLTDARRAELDGHIADLEQGIAAWADLRLSDRASLLEATRACVRENAESWTLAAIRAKQVPPGPWEGEEWMSGPYVALASLETTADSLSALTQGRSPAESLPMGTGPGGRTTVKVLPSDLMELALFHGFTGEVWMPPGVSADDVRARAGLGARHPGENNGVGLVLGAGNISSIGPLDALYELVAFNRASILKLNPTFAGLEDVYNAAFAPLVEAGLLRIVEGAAQVGGYLAHHDRISHVHITGSAQTHDAIVWGTGEEATRRRAAGDPLLDKEITSELGGVSPIIVVPGEWTRADLRYQAEHVATQRLHNSGHNCVAAQALILSADWPQKDDFLDALRGVLDELPPRSPWYPGADRKLDEARRAYPDAEDHAGRLLLAADAAAEEAMFTSEYFGPVLGHVELPGTGRDFLDAAVDFANDCLYGTLGANVLIKPSDRAQLGPAFDAAIAALRYGTVAINAWTGVAFSVPTLPWGAYAGHTVDDVGSGVGLVHNAHLIEAPEKAVVTGPFRESPRSLRHGELSISPKPPWFVTHRMARTTAKRLTENAGDRSWKRMPGVIGSALRG